MMRKKWFMSAFLLLPLMIGIVACQPETIVETVVEEVEVTKIVTETIIEEGEQVEVTRQVTVVEEVIVEVPVEDATMEDVVTLNINWSTEPPTADPSLSTDTTSNSVITSMFMRLVRLDPVTGEIIPWLATDWESGENDEGKQTWTFNMRTDVPWVKYDPMTGEVTQEVDEEGNPRFVTADDLVYGVKRIIDPETAADFAYLYYLIENAEPVNAGEEGFSLDDVGVVALDESTVQFTLESPAAFFLSVLTGAGASPLPQWAIEEWGNQWIEPGLLVTNGPYVMESWIHGSELNLIKNPLWPDADQVQIERIEGIMITEASTSFALYENNELDTDNVPQTEIDRVKSDSILSEDFYVAPRGCTYYYGFTNTKPPFDDARVRRAFSQAIDRQSLIDNVTKGDQLPASSFAPPGTFGAPEPGTVGVFYNVEEAQANLQSYLDENGLTLEDFNNLNITLMHNTSEGHARIAAAIQQMWKDNLGADVNVENQEWAVYLETTQNSTPIEEAPHIWRLGWCGSADQDFWLHSVFNAEESENRSRRSCADANCTEIIPSEFDELTLTARVSEEPTERIELYEQAELILAYDEAAYAPIYHYTTVNVTKPWLTRTYPAIGAPHYFEWSIDWEQKQAAQN